MSSQFLFVFFCVRGVYLTRSSRLSQGFVYAGLQTALQGLGFGFSVVGSESRGYGMLSVCGLCLGVSPERNPQKEHLRNQALER